MGLRISVLKIFDCLASVIMDTGGGILTRQLAKYFIAVPVRDSVTVHLGNNEDNVSLKRLTFSVHRKILLQGQEDFKEAVNRK